MAFCSNCGHQLADGAKFCYECGTKVNLSATSQEEQRKTVYDGEIHKCPNCGEVINSFVSICPACGFEFRGTRISSSLQEFIEKVDQCDTRIANSTHKQTGWESWSKTKRVLWVLFNLCFMGIPLVVYLVWPLATITMTPRLSVEERQLVALIENFPFPNERESILAALMFAKEKIDFISKEKVNKKSAYWMRLWCAKAEQLKQKADMMFPNDPIVKDSYNEILADEAQVKKTIKIKGIIGLVVLAIVIIFAIFRYGVLDRVGVTSGTDYSATFEWQNYGLFTQVPEPDTNNGKIVRESTDQIHIELYHISTEDFNNYVKECKNAGFTVDVTKTDQVFYAHDEEGYDLSIFFYEDKKTMNIYVDSYDIDGGTQSENTVGTENTTIDTTDSATTDTKSTVVSQDTIQQFINGYEKAEFSKYDSSEEGTQFAESRIYFYCTLDQTEILEANGTTTILGHVTDDSGNEWLIQLHFVPAVSRTAFDGFVGKNLILRGVYSGYSEARDIPVVVLDETIVLNTGENILGMQKLLDD